MRKLKNINIDITKKVSENIDINIAKKVSKNFERYRYRYC